MRRTPRCNRQRPQWQRGVRAIDPGVSSTMATVAPATVPWLRTRSDADSVRLAMVVSTPKEHGRTVICGAKLGRGGHADWEGTTVKHFIRTGGAVPSLALVLCLILAACSGAAAPASSAPPAAT